MRVSWDEYFIGIVDLIKTRSTCLRRQVGALIVKDKRILATGYNGSPVNCEHCLDVGCIRERLNVNSGEKHELCRSIHAEQNAIVQAANTGVSIKDSIIYISHQPCVLCSKIIINAGIIEVVYREDYPDKIGLELLKESNIKVRKIS